ncbi:MAG TPA: Hpt domain-containing protein [Puia sp.]|nr:Hpt domain-containing protein [Puia sp.]
MNNYPTDNPFIFNSEINAQHLAELYGDDYEYVEEVFTTVLNEYAALTDNVIACYTSQNIAALKSAVHKIKPIFGFVGLIKVQEQCQQFENACQTAGSFDVLINDFSLLKNSLIKSKTLIEDEKKKLGIYNTHRA